MREWNAACRQQKAEAAESPRLSAWKYALTHIFLLNEMPPFGGRKQR